MVSTELEVHDRALDRARFRSEALVALRRGVLSIDDHARDLAEAGDMTGLAEGGQDLQTLLGDLHAVMDYVRVELGRLVDEADDERRQDEHRAKVEAWEAKVAAANEAGRRPPKPPKDLELKATGPKRAEIAGVGVVECNGGWTRKDWRSEELLVRLLRIALDEFSIFTPDGEDAHDEAYERLMTVLTECLPITASLSWRTGKFPRGEQAATGLRLYGIDDADYCERVSKPRLATIPRPKGTT